MSERILSTGKIAVFVLCALIAAGLGVSELMTPGPVGGASCKPAESVLGNFEAAEAGTQAPDAPFQDAAGKDRRIADHAGRGVVLNFWATWCAPCVREMPQLDRLKALVADNGIDVLAVSEDRQGVPLVEKFFAANKLGDLEILVDGGAKLQRAAKLRGLPTTILYRPDGTEAGRVVGVAEWDAEAAVTFLRQCLGTGTPKG